MTYVLDFDDFSLENNQIFYLNILKEHFPKLKVSMFMIPFDAQYHEQMMDFQREESIEWIKKNSDWLEIIPHGLTHIQGEFTNATEDLMKLVKEGIDVIFTKQGLPYVNGFKAPYWLYNQEMVEYFDSIGWFMAVDRNQPEAPRTKKYYEYSHSIHEPFWDSKDELIKLHGHISLPSDNNLPDNMMNLMKMDLKADFKFVSECLCEQ